MTNDKHYMYLASIINIHVKVLLSYKKLVVRPHKEVQRVFIIYIGSFDSLFI